MIKHLLSAVLVSTVLVACGGGSSSEDNTTNPIGNNPDTDTPVATASPTPTVTASPLPTASPIPTIIPLPTISPLPTVTPAPTIAPSPSPLPTLVPTPEPTPLPTPVPTPLPTPTIEPSPLPSPTPAPLTITPDNAVELAASVTTSVLKTDIPISTEIAGILTAVVARNSATLDHSKLLSTVLDGSAGSAEKTRFPSEPLACEISGSLAYSGNVQSLERFTEGDILRLTFDDCVNSSGNTSDGTIVYTVTTFEGSLSLSRDYSLSYQMELDFTHTTASREVNIQGDIATGMSQNDNTHSTALRSSNLLITVNGNTRQVGDFIYVQAFDENNSTLTLRTSGFINSDELGGTLNFNAPQAFTLQAGNTQPSAGEYVLTDIHGATLTMSVLEDGLVSLAIDSNGDDATDYEIQSTWSEIIHFFEK